MMDVDVLKKDCIYEFLEYIKFLLKGYLKNYNNILNMICYINYNDEFKNHELITQYLLNNNLHVSIRNKELLNCKKINHYNKSNPPLLRNNFLGEYKSNIDKKKVIDNLGIDDYLSWEIV